MKKKIMTLVLIIFAMGFISGILFKYSFGISIGFLISLILFVYRMYESITKEIRNSNGR